MKNDFTEGPILGPLLQFVFPVMFAMLLQAMYGAVDLVIVGQFATAADVSAVSIGSQLLLMMTDLIASLAMGATICLGQMIGAGDRARAGQAIGAAVAMFLTIGTVLTFAVPSCANILAALMQTPEESFALTASYLRICGTGAIVIVIYNLISAIFRGLGDSHTPLVTVFIACICNIIGDLYFVADLGMGTRGVAIATVMAQGISVIISIIIIRVRRYPIHFEKRYICFERKFTSRIFELGFPIAIQDVLVSFSFLIIQGIVNTMGLEASAGIGVAEKVCSFIMLVPAAFMQSMAAFVAQNYGAGKYRRAKRALAYAVSFSTILGVAMFYVAFWHGDLLAMLFTQNPEVVAAAADYLKAYGIDCLLTCFLFCFVGYYNGLGMTHFVMMQGICGALLIRVPVAFYMASLPQPTLFSIGLAIPCSTVVQIILCFLTLIYANKKTSNEGQFRKVQPY